jgi:hypothetical protein
MKAYWGSGASYPMGTGALSLEVKRPGRAADHSPPSSAEVEEYTYCTVYKLVTVLHKLEWNKV